MKQIFIQKGIITIGDVQPPTVEPEGILVETRAMAISVGTETRGLKQTGRHALSNVISSAMLRQKVIPHIRQGSLWFAFRRKMGLAKPISPSRALLGLPTGYSCAGLVLEVGEGILDVQPGDRVACAGSSHAEIVHVPRNLFVPIPDGVGDDEAAFVAIGSIALHGVRQAGLSFGETVLVMGLGLVGQLVAQLARASGVRTIVTDPLPERLDLARRMGADLALPAIHKEIVAKTLSFTEGAGVDAVILCMGGSSPKPVQQALDVLRDRGRMVVVGTPRMDIPRALFYRKEIELRIARSYGPGRYDPEYEENGHDYPLGYVRWTERRNMAEFLRLVSEKRIDLASLITHRFPLVLARKAYETAIHKNRTTLGIVILSEAKSAHASPLKDPVLPQRRIGVAVVGAGAFANAFHLPHVAAIPELHLRMVIDRDSETAARAGKAFDAATSGTSLEEALRDPSVELVILTTPHHLHASQTIAALDAGKAVFCEKPMGMNRDEVLGVVAAQKQSKGFYAIGFNRRFAPTVARAKTLLAGHKGPLVMNYRVMGTFLPADHWVYNPSIGGGRIIGEACHFFDLLCFLAESPLRHLTATGGALSHPGTDLQDNVLCTMAFEDGSIASLIYGDFGHPQLPKERLEIFCGEGNLVIDDFRELKVHGFSGQRGMKLPAIDKGHRAELEAISRAMILGQPSPIDAQTGWMAMQCAFRTQEALASGRPQSLHESEVK